MIHRYFEEIYEGFGVTEEEKSIFERISRAPSQKRENILTDMDSLVRQRGLAYALIALYRQQVNAGFVLADPLKADGIEEKKIYDANTGITFRVQWNPNRELRKVRKLLIERGVIANIDEMILINKDENGRACFLCKSNIDKQNPAEILFEIYLAGDRYYTGANFAYITNNHFTIMNAEHRPQKYRKQILEALNDFVDITNGYFRSIFNGLAGSSIEEHEHLQVTTEKFPIEEIEIDKNDVVYETDNIRISQPNYYISTWLIEGKDKKNIINAADNIINSWHEIDENHTENIICAKIGILYRTFIITRDKRKLAGKWKKEDMTTFDTGGIIVLSYIPTDKETFDKTNFDIIKVMLREISPSKQLKEINW